MKSLIKTYVDPMLEDQIKILANKSGNSVSALTAELISRGCSGQQIPNDILSFSSVTAGA